jgi:hypothetical protein
MKKTSFASKIEKNNKLKLFSKGNFSEKRIIIAVSSAVIILSSVLTSTYFLMQKHKESTVAEQNLEKAFPTLEYHYSTISDDKKALINEPSDLKLFISLNNSSSKNAYLAARDFAEKNNLKLKIYHLAQNPEWQTPSKIFHALQTLKPDIDLLPYFDFFEKTDSNKNYLVEIIPLLLKENINSATFNSTFASIDVLRSTNKDIELTNNLEISHIPLITIHDKYTIYFGSFDSFEDSLRLYDALK